MAHNSVERQCETCGTSFWTNNSKLRDGNGKYCSRRCFTASRKITYVELTCAVCQGQYSLELGQYNSRIKQGHPVKYCSIQCAHKSPEFSRNISESLKRSEKARAAHARAIGVAHAKLRTPEGREQARQNLQKQLADPQKKVRWIEGIKRRSNNPQWRDAPTHTRGKSNPNYKGNKKERNIAMGRYEYKQWRKAVFKHDGYTCQKCHTRGGKLVAHHIKPWAEYPELRYDVLNGIALCEHCHDLEHGKIRKPKTFKCVICGIPKTSARSPRCQSCGAKTRGQTYPRALP